MLTELYIEAPLIGEELADLVWEAQVTATISDDMVTLAGYSGSGCGAVAQLGERRVRNAEVGSSILLGSTNLLLNTNVHFYQSRSFRSR